MIPASRRQQLRELYGFDFPEDLFRFWELACRLRPLEPLRALEPLGLHVVGPFEVLAGRFDRRRPRHSPLLHWRYYLDPPEFFTVLAGGSDGLHYGYFLDDPADREGCVASYYARDAFEISPDGDSLFDAVRLDLERCYGDFSEDVRQGLPRADAEHLRSLSIFRESLIRYATADRSETGVDYEEAYPPRTRRTARVVAATREGMGVVAPGDTYRPLSISDQKLWRYLRREGNPTGLVAEARQALEKGYPATALKLGKDLWAFGGPLYTEDAYDLLDAGYEALRRPVLREVLRAHRENRELPSVDILEDEEGG